MLARVGFRGALRRSLGSDDFGVSDLNFEIYNIVKWDAVNQVKWIQNFFRS